MNRIVIKNSLAIFILFTMIFQIGCETSNSKTNSDKIVVVSSITIINDIVRNIGKDKVEASAICAIGTDPHTYKSVPSDSRKIASADLIFINGFGLEGWINKLIKASGENKPVVTVSEGIIPLKDDKGHGDPDPHCWFDISYAKIYAENIAKGLIKVDSLNKEFYLKNLVDYISKLDSLDSWAKDELSKIPSDKRILITSHDAFRYFGKAYKIRVEALQGISTEAKPQTADVARLVDLIKKVDLPAVFIETSVNPKLLEQISLETNAKIGGTLYSDSIGEESSAGNSFINAFKFNVNTIVSKLIVD